jgi:short-subunit dehydrogenase
LEGKHVVVTGASKGVGAALARELVMRRCQVTALARSDSLLREQSRELGTNPIAVDLADLPSCDDLLRRIEGLHGPIDVLVNNAAHPGFGAFTEMSARDVRDALTVNLLAPAELARQATTLMRGHGSGQIVNISSIAAGLTLLNDSLYTASKGGLTNLSRSLSHELRHSGINVLLVVLGIVRGTELLELISEDPVMARSTQLFSKLPTTTPRTAAVAIVDAVERERSLAVIPRAFTPLIRVRHGSDLITSRLTGAV